MKAIELLVGACPLKQRLLPRSATVSPSAFIELSAEDLGSGPRLVKDGKLQPCSPSCPLIVSSF
jgi:hypothetical protein